MPPGLSERPWLLAVVPDDPTGTPVPPAGGGVIPVPVPGPPPVPAAPGVPTPRTFTQDELSAIATREADRARRAAGVDLARQLGYETVDAMTAAIADAKKITDAAKTEQQRAVEAADAARREADTAKAAAAAQVHQIRVERALLAAGLPPLVDGQPNPALGMAAKLVEADQAADDAAVTAAVAAVRTAVPVWFQQIGAPAAGNPGHGPVPATGQPAAGGDVAAGMAIANRLFGDNGRTKQPA